MLFGKNKLTFESLAAMKETNPEGYAAIMGVAKTEVEHEESVELVAARAALAANSALNERAVLDAKISQYGSALKVEDVAKTAITGKLDFNTALLAMVDAHIKSVKDIEEAFETTGSEGVGEGSENLEEAPKTFAAAITFIKKRDGIKGKAAVEKAQEEFKELFESQYE